MTDEDLRSLERDLQNDERDRVLALRVLQAHRRAAIRYFPVNVTNDDIMFFFDEGYRLDMAIDLALAEEVGFQRSWHVSWTNDTWAWNNLQFEPRPPGLPWPHEILIATLAGITRLRPGREEVITRREGIQDPTFARRRVIEAEMILFAINANS
jgi:hypothetical protein